MPKDNALVAGLYCIGIPKSIRVYETAMKSDMFVPVMHGTTEKPGEAKGRGQNLGRELHTAFQ